MWRNDECKAKRYEKLVLSLHKIGNRIECTHRTMHKNVEQFVNKYTKSDLIEQIKLIHIF